MDELCPLCLKMGANSRIKAVQINLSEALWTCESEECPWPFLGPDEPTFFSRKVGEKWAYEWQTYRRVKERVGSIPVSAELSLYTPPVTPSSDASAKETLQSEVGKNILESSAGTDIFSSDASPRDSYAPRSTAETVSLAHKKAGSARDSNSAKNVALRPDGDSKIVEKSPAARSSIFDIDAEDFISNKINANLRPDSESSDRLEKNPEQPIDRLDAVLKTVAKPDFAVKSREIKEAVAVLKENGENGAKRAPQIRSIARTKIDLQRFDAANVVKIETPIWAKNVEAPATPPRRKSADAADWLVSPTQRTTTIKVDGIPPIVLSYDLTDLGGKTEEIQPQTREIQPQTREIQPQTREIQSTSTPNPTRKSSRDDEDRDEDSSAEAPKKRARISANRRNAGAGKNFEKFSFSALKKDAKAFEKFSFSALKKDAKNFEKFSFSALKEAAKRSNTADATPKVKTEPPQLEDVLRSDDTSSTKDSGATNALANSSVCETVNVTSSQRVEAPSSTNPDANCSIASTAVDNLNLSCLIDDMLLDGYQNATQNLNDDWLESFFTENT